MARSDSGNARGAVGGVEVPAGPIGLRAIPESAPPVETRDPAEVPEPAAESGDSKCSGRVGVRVSPKKYPQAWAGVYGFK